MEFLGIIPLQMCATLGQLQAPKLRQRRKTHQQAAVHRLAPRVGCTINDPVRIARVLVVNFSQYL